LINPDFDNFNCEHCLKFNYHVEGFYGYSDLSELNHLIKPPNYVCCLYLLFHLNYYYFISNPGSDQLNLFFYFVLCYSRSHHLTPLSDHLNWFFHNYLIDCFFVTDYIYQITPFQTFIAFIITFTVKSLNSHNFGYLGHPPTHCHFLLLFNICQYYLTCVHLLIDIIYQIKSH